jgi:hypothetical protein
MVSAARDDNNEQKRGYYCDNCEETFVYGSAKTEIPMIKNSTDSIYLDGDYYFFSEECEEGFTVWACADDCYHLGDEPEYEPLWECGECDNVYTEKARAASCCD